MKKAEEKIKTIKIKEEDLKKLVKNFINFIHYCDTLNIYEKDYMYDDFLESKKWVKKTFSKYINVDDDYLMKD